MGSSRIVTVLIAVALMSILAFSVLVLLPLFSTKAGQIAMAVEFNDHSAAAWIALDKGFFEEEGLNVTRLETFTTGLELSAALTKGDVDVAWACLGPLILARAQGVPIVVVAQAHLHGYAVVGKPGVRDIKQLDRGVVACPGVGSPSYLLLRMVIDKYGLNVTIKSMKLEAILNSLITGQIEAAALPEHHVTLAVKRGNCTVLVRSQDVWPEMPGSFLVVKKELLEKHPELVARLVKVTIRATKFINEKPQEAARIVAKRLGITFEEALESMRWLQYDNQIDVAQVERYVELMTKYGLVDKPIDVKDFVDTSVLSKVLGG
jgi:NitT/TauT family transport system substrate-binding protein